MTNKTQGLDRRRFLMGTSAVGVAMALGIPFSRVDAAGILHQAAPELPHYKPAFFNDAEFKAICAICDCFIPEDDTGPGALESNVPVFIDLQLSSDYGKNWYLKGPFPKNPSPLMYYQLPYLPAEQYRIGLEIIDKAMHQQYEKAFADLSSQQQNDVLSQLESGDIDFSQYDEDYLTSSGFFSQMLTDTKNGYLADPMYGGNKGMGAWKMIGFPGARASFREWVTQHNVPYPLGPVSIKGEEA